MTHYFPAHVTIVRSGGQRADLDSHAFERAVVTQPGDLGLPFIKGQTSHREFQGEHTTPR